MATLLEKLRQGLATAATPAAPVDETGQVQALVSAKSGLVGAKPQYRTKSLAESAAQQQTQLALSEQAEQAGIQAAATQQAFAGQEQRQTQAEQEVKSQQETSRIQTRLKTENILKELERGRKELSQQQKELQMEQAGALLRFQSKQYTDQLRLEGEKARLQDATKFNEELARTLLEDNIALLKTTYEDQAARDLSDRDFEKMLTEMGAYEALQMAQANAAQAEKQAQIQGAATVAKEGMAAYGTYKSGAKEGKYDEGYQSYRETTTDRTPMSYGAWQNKQAESKPGFTGPTREQAGK